jgi:hypothetical protein
MQTNPSNTTLMIVPPDLVQKCNQCEQEVTVNQHCCCEQVNCGGRYHRITINHCAGSCADCGWGGCACIEQHCCCALQCSGHSFAPKQKQPKAPNFKKMSKKVWVKKQAHK